MPVYSLGSERQGIVHVIGPELGVTQPGMTIVCGDSHTSTHGAFGALAFGIGTSEVEHVLATQCMVQHKPRSMRIRYDGELGFGVTAKDLILGTLGQLGVGGMTGHVVEYAGPAIEALSMEGPHDRLQHDDRGRRARGHDRARRDDVRLVHRAGAPGRAARRRARGGDRALARAAHRRGRDVRQRGRRSTPSALSPQVTWGTNPGHGARRSPSACPRPRSSTARRPRGDRARAALHGARARHADRGDRARPRVHRLVHELAHRRPARRRRGRRRAARSPPSVERDGRAGLRSRSRRRPRPRAWTRSSATPASTGASRAARCAWA